MHLATCGRFVYFGFMGSHNQLCISHMLINVFFIQGQQKLLKRKGKIKIACGQVPWSVELVPRHDVSIMWKTKPANQKHCRHFMDICLQSQKQTFRVMAGCMFSLATDVRAETLQSYIRGWRKISEMKILRSCLLLTFFFNLV